MSSCVEDQPRRRRFTDDFKRRIVELALSPGASISKVSSAHQLNASLVFRWCVHYKQGRLGPMTGDEVSLLPVNLTSETSAESPGKESESAGRMTLKIGRSTLDIQGRVDIQSLHTVLQCLVR